MDEYIVPDNEVEIITSDENVAREDVVPAVCYEVPLTYQPSDEGEKPTDQDNMYEPGEYIEGVNEDSADSQPEMEDLNDEKIFSMIPRSIQNPQSKKTTFLTHECVYVLVKWVFERRYNPFPTDAQKTQLSTITKLPIPEIEIWLSMVRKSIVPIMIMKGADFINNYMKYHVENVKAQGRITVANFHNKRVLLKKIGSDPVIIGKIQYSSHTPQKVQYVVPIKVQKVINKTVASEIKEPATPKVNYEPNVPADSNFDKSIKSPPTTKPAEGTKGNAVSGKARLDLNSARYLMTWLFNYRKNPFPTIDQLRHISDVTGLPGARVLRWMFTARKKILKKVRHSNTVLDPEMFKECLTWHLNDLPGPKRMKQQLAAGIIPQMDPEKDIKTFQLSTHKKSPNKMDTSVSNIMDTSVSNTVDTSMSNTMDTSISADDSYNGDDTVESHRENKRPHSKKGDRVLASNKRLFVKSAAEELHPSESPSDLMMHYSRPLMAHKGASRKGKGNFPLSSKKVLMDWLFKNRHNPYPTDQEKLELSEMSSLTLLQVNNWFINARRRFLDKMLKTGEECFLIKRQHKGFKELTKSYLRESGEVETEIVTYADELVVQDDNQQGTEIQITEYVCTDSADQSMIQYQEDTSTTEYVEQVVDSHIPSNMIEVQVHLLPTKYEEQGSIVRVRCTEDEAVHVLKAVNSHPTVTLKKIPDSEIPIYDNLLLQEEEEEEVHFVEGPTEEV